MAIQEGPWKWLCGWCRTISTCCSCGICEKCSKCFKCSDCCPCLDKCDCRSFFCPCIPAVKDCSPCSVLLCPTEADKLKVEEVSAADYIHEKKKRPRIRRDTPGKKAMRQFASFCLGIIITAIYGIIVLFVRKYNLTFCLITTITLAFFLSLGMAFSMRVRINALLMLPQLFSAEAKAFILLLACTLVVQGPTNNIVQNFRRCTGTMACGAQVALNETKELIAKLTSPILSVMKTIKKVETGVQKSTSGAQKFFDKVKDDVQDAAKSLRSALAFFNNIGGYCYTELERPYKTCTKAFDTAKADCFRVMNFMGFLCYILDVFRPVCGLAKILTFVCSMPNYVEGIFRKYIKIPITSIVKKFRTQFRFNFKGIDNFNKKRIQLKDIAGAIIKELKMHLMSLKEVLGMLSNAMLIFCIFNYIKAMQYRKKYIKDNNHDNVFITRDFIELDVMRAKQNRETLLPLSSSEGYGFIRPGSLKLTRYEKTGYMFAIMNIFRSFLFAALIICFDYLFYYILSLVSYLMGGEVSIQPPLIMSMVVKGSGYGDEMWEGLTSAYNTMQSKKITSFTKKCQIRPSEPDYMMYFLIGLLHGFAGSIAAFGVYVQRLKRYICAYYYPTREKMRICFLYNQLLTKRLQLEKALFQSIRNNEADKGHTNFLLILAAKCPFFFSWLANFVGANEEYCLACAQVCTSKNNTDYHRCVTPGCKGLYCAGCSKILKECCTICMAPLLNFSLDEELDSSDDETFNIWLEGMKGVKSDKSKKNKMRKTIKARLKENFKRRGSCSVLTQKFKDSKAESDTEDSSGLSDADSADDRNSDSEYQKSKDHDNIYIRWSKPPKTSQKKADLIPLPQIQKKTTKGQRRKRERDLEKGP